MSLGVSGYNLFFEFEVLKLAFRYVATSLYLLVYQLLLSPSIHNYGNVFIHSGLSAE